MVFTILLNYYLTSYLFPYLKMRNTIDNLPYQYANNLLTIVTSSTVRVSVQRPTDSDILPVGLLEPQGQTLRSSSPPLRPEGRERPEDHTAARHQRQKADVGECPSASGERRRIHKVTRTNRGVTKRRAAEPSE